MTGKNVETLNTKSCLNMIYNILLVLALPDQSATTATDSFRRGAAIFLASCYTPDIRKPTI